MATIVGIADTHGKHNELQVPAGDILVVAGDITNIGKMPELIEFNRWLGTLPHKHKIVVAGNHDFFCEKDPNLTKQLFTNAIYLDMAEATVMGIKFWGCPWTPWFYDWAFNYPRTGDRVQRMWDAVPEDVNVLVTHGPPAHTTLGITNGYMDQPPEDAGCIVQFNRILQLPKLQATFCGHIHHGAGVDMIQDRVKCHNVAVVNEKYQVVRHGLTYEYK